MCVPTMHLEEKGRGGECFERSFSKLIEAYWELSHQVGPQCGTNIF